MMQSPSDPWYDFYAFSPPAPRRAYMIKNEKQNKTKKQTNKKQTNKQTDKTQTKNNKNKQTNKQHYTTG